MPFLMIHAPLHDGPLIGEDRQADESLVHEVGLAHPVLVLRAPEKTLFPERLQRVLVPLRAGRAVTFRTLGKPPALVNLIGILSRIPVHVVIAGMESNLVSRRFDHLHQIRLGLLQRANHVVGGSRAVAPFQLRQSAHELPTRLGIGAAVVVLLHVVIESDDAAFAITVAHGFRLSDSSANSASYAASSLGSS